MRGGVALSTYASYLVSLGAAALVLVFVSLVGLNVGGVGSDYWLGLWSTDALARSTTFYLSVYAALTCATALVTLLNTVSFALGGIEAAAALHRRMFARVLRAPVSFFDTTPLGRILNRFSSDVATVDKDLPASFGSYVQLSSRILATIIVQAVILPFTVLGALPIGLLYGALQSFYRQSSRELKRLDAISKSPVYAHLSETLAGLATIRAFRAEPRFAAEFTRRLDRNNVANFLGGILINRWLGLRLDWIGALLVGVVALVSVLTAGSANAGLVGLALSYALNVTGLLNWLVRGSTETETYLSSVERQEAYAALPVERPPVVEANRPPAEWPARGAVSFRGVAARYRPELEQVLRGVSFEVAAGSRVGVCGRTGSGKSSLMLALFRIVELERGQILLDGVDIAGVGLDDLRSRLAIIPQDPTLFAGELRYNLDPLGAHSDLELLGALERVGLGEAARALGGLGGKVAEGGENLSTGERQLVCLARALLRKARVLVLDEATASVDVATDALVQRMLREAFAGCTVLTIAHRINTIVDSDRILVLDAGEVAEFGAPQELLAREGGAFRGLVHGAGARGGEGGDPVVAAD
jgi:ATP-binding cassette subfamily C (CFTR/MRP) protein 1